MMSDFTSSYYSAEDVCISTLMEFELLLELKQDSGYYKIFYAYFLLVKKHTYKKIKMMKIFSIQKKDEGRL
jgi:hypothetical protein